MLSRVKSEGPATDQEQDHRFETKTETKTVFFRIFRIHARHN